MFWCLKIVLPSLASRGFVSGGDFLSRNSLCFFVFFNFELCNKFVIIAVRLTSPLNYPHQLPQLVRFPSGPSFLVKSATVRDFSVLYVSSPRLLESRWVEVPPRTPPDSECSQSPTLRDLWNKVTPIHFPWSFRRFYIITEHRSLSATCNKPGFCLWISGLGMCVRPLGGSSVPTLYFVFCILYFVPTKREPT